ncbi:MAG: HD domain-containing protein [Rhodocyclaceae bacterium]|nr:MAG: HD domain-containing protein [Rhodocyclaceae bacterium]
MSRGPTSVDRPLVEIGKLIFELTVIGSATADLDILLERLFGILREYHDLPILPCGAVVLRNPRRRYIQVAQFGMAPPWQLRHPWSAGPFAEQEIRDQAFIAGPLPDMPTEQRLLLLPLRTEDRGIGYAVLFTPKDYHPESEHLSFMTDLGRALSGIVERTLINETLRIRELELEEARSDIIHHLGVASEYRDNETGLHIMRMTNFAQVIAKAMGLSEELRELLYIAAPMYDVGKIGIADAILLKPGRLSPDEFEVMKTHTRIGVTILNGNDPLISAAREIAGCHHEHWDGSGYPKGLKGEEIPVLARVCAVADVFDALTSIRPYKKPWPVEEAARWIENESGKHFDPAVVAAFKQAMPEILRIRELYRDDIIDPRQVLTLPPLERKSHSWLPWDESLGIGISIIDEHHRYLFDLINDLYDVIVNKRGIKKVGRLVKALGTYAKVHFRAEEQMMGHYGYGELPTQERQHHAFEEKLKEFYEELHANPLVAQFDVLTYLQEWLVHHIKTEDAKLRVLAA